MAACSLRLSSAEIDEMTHPPADFSAIYTNFLTQYNTLFAHDHGLDTDESQLQALMSNPSMPHGHVARWWLNEVSYECVPMCTSLKDLSDIEACSWEEALQTIEDHDWLSTGQNGAQKSSIINTKHINRSFEIAPESLQKSSTTTVYSDEAQAVQVSETPTLNEAKFHNIDRTGQQLPSSSDTSEGDTTNECAKAPITEFATTVSDVDTYTAGTLQLQAAPNTRPGYEFSGSFVAALAEATDQSSSVLCTKNNQHVLPMPRVLQDRGVLQGVQAQYTTKNTLGTDCANTLTLPSSEVQFSVHATYIEQTKETGAEHLGHPLEKTVLSAEERPLLSCRLSEPRRSRIIREEHNADLSSDVEFYDVASTAETVTTSVAGFRANTVNGLDDNERLFQCVNLPGEMGIDQVDRSTFTTVSNGADVQSGDIVKQTNKGTVGTHMVDVRSPSQHATEVPLIVADDRFISGTTEYIAEMSDEVQTTELTITPNDKVKIDDINGFTEAAVHGNGSSQPDVDLPTSLHDPGVQHDSALPSAVGLKDSVTDERTLTKDADMTATQAYSALDSREAKSPSWDLQLEEAAVNNECCKSHSPAHDNQNATPLHEVVCETMETSNPGPMSLAQTVATSEVFLMPLTDQNTPSQEIDLSSIMASLAAYSLSMSTSINELKRPLSCTEPDVDTNEEPVTKKQKLDPGEPVAGEPTSTGEMMVAERSVSEGVEHNSARKIVLGETPMHAEDTVVSDAQVEVKIKTNGAVISKSVAEGFVEGQSEPVIDDRTTVYTSIATKEASPDPSDLAPLRIAFGNKTSELYTQQSPETHEHHMIPEMHPNQFTGPCVQTTDIDMQERFTTASLSPPLQSPIPAPYSVSVLRGPKITFKPLKPPTTHEGADVGALEPAMNEDGAAPNQLADDTDVDHSDELSEADDEQLNMLSSLVNEPINRPTIKTEEAPVPQNSVAAIKESTPRHSKPSLLRDFDLGYGRRTTRSETTTSAHASTSASRHDELDSLPVPVPKKERTPAPAAGVTVKASTPGKKPKDGTAAGGKKRQTRSAATEGKAASTPRACSESLAPSKPSAGLQHRRNTAHKIAQKSAAEVKAMPKPAARAAARSKTKIPMQHEVSPLTRKVTLKAAAGSKAKSTATALGEVWEKRKTRRASAAEEEIRKGAEKEENIGKRLRSQGGE